MIDQIFSDVYNGILSTSEALKILHLFCNTKGLNPALEMPMTMLMVSEHGRNKLQGYETFQTRVNWLMAKLSAKVLAIESALEEFWTILADLSEEMIQKTYNKNEQEEKRVKSYFRMLSCPTCGLQGKMAEGYKDIN